MITLHIKTIYFNDGWHFILHSGALISPHSLNLASAILEVGAYVHPQPTMSNTTIGQLLDPELRGAA